MPHLLDRPHIVHHKAALDGRHPPNSLDSVAACAAAGADWVEIDIAALADGDFIVLHDLDLASETDGSGPAAAMSAAASRKLRSKPTLEHAEGPIAILTDVVELLARSHGPTRLQLDLKDERPYATAEPLERLARIVEPLGERVLVSSTADWQLRRLHAIEPRLALGFDPLLYFAWWPPEFVDPSLPPYRLGAYGYLDEHPLAAARDQRPTEYLGERCQTLLEQVPGISVLYVYHHLLSRCLADGFSWAAACHERGIALDAWTMDATKKGIPARVRELAAAGVDLFTTNTPREMAALLRG